MKDAYSRTLKEANTDHQLDGFCWFKTLKNFKTGVYMGKIGKWQRNGILPVFLLKPESKIQNMLLNN